MNFRINWQKTADLYDTSVPLTLPEPPSLLFDRELVIRRRVYVLVSRLYHRATGRNLDLFADILKIQAAIQKRSASNHRTIKVILRVDDFPRSDLPFEEFLRFWDVIQAYRVPIVLGVTPLLALDPLSPSNTSTRRLTQEEAAFLREISRQGHKIALHGLTHAVRGKLKAEYVGVDAAGVEENVTRGLEELARAGLSTDSIIPPFNAFDATAFDVFQKHFRVVYGGPESIAFFGGGFSPAYVGDTLYMASYGGIYGRAKAIVSQLERYDALLNVCPIAYLPITLHWAWEWADHYEYLELLLRLISHLFDPIGFIP